MDTSTPKAPFDPFEGLIVPVKKSFESTCIKITDDPNVIALPFLLSQFNLNCCFYEFAFPYKMA